MLKNNYNGIPISSHMREGEMEISSSVAFPTIGIVLLGGISDQNRRIPMHDSAGIA